MTIMLECFRGVDAAGAFDSGINGVYCQCTDFRWHDSPGTWNTSSVQGQLVFAYLADAGNDASKQNLNLRKKNAALIIETRVNCVIIRSVSVT